MKSGDTYQVNVDLVFDIDTSEDLIPGQMQIELNGELHVFGVSLSPNPGTHNHNYNIY